MAAAIIVLQVAAAGWPASSRAADGDQLPATVAAVVDYQRVLQEAAASRSIAEQMDARRKAYQDEIAQQEQRLYEAEIELTKQRSGKILSDEAAAARQKELEAEVQAVRELTQKRRQQLEQTSAERSARWSAPCSRS
ncbi:MAG: hypothetical protein HC871_16470 [Rhizobiales bacterium]|nr:hypothetical protein [Hyphomicrobiales bacterium]